MIAINQDPLGKQADLLKRTVHLGGFKEIWGGPLSNKKFILIFFNRSPSGTNFEVDFSELLESKSIKITAMRDILNHKDLEVPSDGKTIKTDSVRKHASFGYVVSWE